MATPQRNGARSPRITVQPVAPATSVACPTTSPHAAKLVTLAIRRSILEPLRRRRRLLRTCAALHHAAHVAHDADEGAALHARVALRGSLLFAAGAADHRIAFSQSAHGLPPPPFTRRLAALGRSPSSYSRIFLISVAREMPSSR